MVEVYKSIRLIEQVEKGWLVCPLCQLKKKKKHPLKSGLEDKII